MGLAEARLWALCRAEYDALKRQWQRARDQQLLNVAAIRADLHNTSARNFQRHFEPADFLEAKVDDVETRARKLMEMGYAPAEAAALASSRQSSEHKLYLVGRACETAHAQKVKKKRA